MTVLQAFWLGLVQGLTEFLPVSSSGHLLLLQKVFGISSESILLEVLLHVGTLFAVVIVYWKRLIHMLRHPIQSELWLLVIATLPAVAAALLFDIGPEFRVQFLGFAFLITSLILWFADLIDTVSPKNKQVKWYNALIMGIMQGIAALFDGMSRSGSTISGGVASGLTRKRAADFSFLMSVPAILGALVLNLKDLFDGSAALVIDNPLPVAVAVITSAVFGLVAIKFMLAIIRKVKLSWFGLYTAVLGILVLIDTYYVHFFF